MTTPKFHVVVVGARPAKGADNKYLAIPQENVDFIHATLNKLSVVNYAGIYHGAGPGIDQIVANWCVANQVPQFQFPAYWQDWDFQANQFTTDKYAAAKRSRQMIRAAKDAVYDATTENNQRPNEYVTFLGFANPGPNGEAVIDDDLKYITESIDRLKNNPYQKTPDGKHRVLAMPVSMVPTQPQAPTTVVNSTGQQVLVTNPF